MKLFKITVGKKIQLLIIPTVISALCVLGAISFFYVNNLLSTTILMCALAYVACCILLTGIVALSEQSMIISQSQLPHLHHPRHASIQSSMTEHQKSSVHISGLASDSIKHQLQARRYMEMLLRTALSNNEFTILYQPKISTKTGRICGVEALVRWYHPDLGWFAPDVFIPIAEESGLIIPLGHWVLKTVCQKIKKWQELGFEHLKFSVNLSAHQFKRGDIVEDIANILWETQIAPFSLELELTETVLMENTEKYVLMLDVLKSMGITISIDDFGTGYSSLSYLRRFPIDALKIDKSFVMNIKEDQEDSIIKAIIAMAKGLGIKTTAEGVETKEQANYLIENEVDELQGFYISTPLTEDELTSLLHEDSAQVIAIRH